MQKLFQFLKKYDNKDISKIAYPVIIFLTGFYIISNLYRLATVWNWGPANIGYTIVWTLVPIGFAYLFLKKIKLIFKWSILSIIGFILIIVFIIDAAFLLIDPHLHVDHLLLTGQWDHTFFPIAFGVFFLCDLKIIPKRFWYILFLFAIFNLIPNLNVISNLLFDSWIIHTGEGGPPGFFTFFGAENWNEYNSFVGNCNYLNSMINYVQEQFTFFTLLPAVIIYNIIKKRKDG